MATNEIFKYSDWISLPVPTGTLSGDPVIVGGATGLVGVAQTTEGENVGTTMVYTPDQFGQIPTSTGFNEAGYASVALTGAWAFTIDGGDAMEAGDPVNISEGTGPDGRNELVAAGGGTARFGHVINHTSDGRVVVRIANPAAAAA